MVLERVPLLLGVAEGVARALHGIYMLRRRESIKDPGSMFSVCLRHADHVRTYSVSPRSDAGWEIKKEQDRTLTSHAWYRDWHRVERTLELFRLEIADLTAHGWQVQSMNR